MPAEISVLVELAKLFGPELVLCGLAVWAFYTNRIYTRKAVEDIIKEKNVQIEREQKQRLELWDIVRPMIFVTTKALEKLPKPTEVGA